MLFEQGPYRIKLDAGKTKGHYSAGTGLGCDCAGCRNYERAVGEMPETLHKLLESFGIDPAAPAEMSVLHSPDGKTLLYDGWFHFCGKIEEGRQPWIETGPRSKRLDERYILELEPGCELWFAEDCGLMAEGFPLPAVQMNVIFPLPWKLSEPNPYV